MQDKMPWQSDDPAEQEQMNLDSLISMYQGQSLQMNMHSTIDYLRTLLEFAFDEAIAASLMNEVAKKYNETDHFKRLLYEHGHPKLDYSSSVKIADCLKFEALVACQYMSLASYLSKDYLNIAWQPMQQVWLHIGNAEGLAHPIINNRIERASKGGRKKASNYDNNIQVLCLLFQHEMPKRGWSSPSAAAYELEGKILQLTKNNLLVLQGGGERNNMLDQVLQLISRNKALRDTVKQTLSKNIKMHKGH